MNSFIGKLDNLIHRIYKPGFKPICDWLDIHYGIPKQDIVDSDYAGKAPWWLRF